MAEYRQIWLRNLLRNGLDEADMVKNPPQKWLR